MFKHFLINILTRGHREFVKVYSDPEGIVHADPKVENLPDKVRRRKRGVGRKRSDEEEIDAPVGLTETLFEPIYAHS